MSLHSAVTGAGVHTTFKWVCANAAARAALTGFVPLDVTKFALQQSDNTIWMLTSIAPAWVNVGVVPSIVNAQPFVSVSRVLTGATHLVCGLDAIRGQLIAWDANNSNYTLSDNWGATWTNLAGKPANIIGNGQAYYKAVRFGAYLYAMHVDSTDALMGIYRAPSGVANVPLVWSTRLTTMAPNIGPAVTGIGTAFNAGQTAMLFGDYGDFTAGPRIQRTTDGVTWTVVWGPDATSRHVHTVIEDPYHPGTWYANIGDTGSNKSVLRSTDDGVSWSVVVAATNQNQWAAVQMSFDPNYIYCAADRPGVTAWYMDRTTLVPRVLSANYHYNSPVPGGQGGRVIADLVTTAGSLTVTSATAAFTALDKGRNLTQVVQFPPGMFISAVNSSTSVTLSNALLSVTGATGSGSGQTAYIEGDRFYANAFMGAADPATGIFYSSPIDTAYAGNSNGILYCLRPGGRFEILDSTPQGYGLSAGEVYFGGGKVFIARNSFPALQFG